MAKLHFRPYIPNQTVLFPQRIDENIAATFKNGGKICSRGDMIEYLWDNQLYVDDNALSVNINRIREKLAGIGLTDFIKTKHRQGYTI